MIKHKLLLSLLVLAIPLVCLVLFLSSITHADPPLPTRPVLPTLPAPDLDQLFSLTNADRVANGVPAVVRDSRLDNSAKAKCADMVRLKQWAHMLADGTSPNTFIDAATDNTDIWVGENLAYGFTSARAVERAWLHSPEHKANIMDPRFTDIGFAVCNVPGYPDSVVEHFTQQ